MVHNGEKISFGSRCNAENDFRYRRSYVIACEGKRIIPCFGNYIPIGRTPYRKYGGKKILYCFGEEGENLLQNKNLSVILRSDDETLLIDLVSPQHSRFLPRLQSEIIDEIPGILPPNFMQQQDPEKERVFMVFGFIVGQFHAVLLNNPFSSAHYLPAIRGGIMQSHRGLVDAAMEQAPFVGLLGHSPRTNTAPMFNGVLSDFVRDIIKVGSDEKHTSRNKNIAPIGERMENEIMDGEIKIRKNETGYPDFRYKFSRGGKERELPLNNTSSMVSELAPISVFVRHHLDKGDLFIVEEPEAHLHPKGQRGDFGCFGAIGECGRFCFGDNAQRYCFGTNRQCRSPRRIGKQKIRRKERRRVAECGQGGGVFFCRRNEREDKG